MVGRSPGSRLAVALLVALAASAGASIAAEAPRRHLTVLYTNDSHAQLDPVLATWLPDTPRLGGFEALSGTIARLRQGRDDVILVDTGDLLSGPAISTLTRGEAPFDLLDAMGYDAMAIGNHEFDVSVPRLEELTWSTSVPVLAANVYWRDSGRRFARPYAILRRGTVRVAVIGVIGADAAQVTLPAQVRDLEFRDPARELKPLVEALRAEVDLVVVLAHEGKTGPMQDDAENHPEAQRDFDADVALAAAVPGIDVLVGGHAHRGIDPPFREPDERHDHRPDLRPHDDARRARARPAGRGQGHRLIPGPARARARRPGDPDARGGPPRRALARGGRRDGLAAVVRVLGTDHPRLRGGVPLGNLLTDLMRTHAGTEIALYNAGGLRADLPAGTVTPVHVTSVLPFNNRVVVLRLTGAAVRAALEQGLSGEHGMVQQSGMVVRFDPDAPAGRRLVSATVGGASLDDGATYAVATIDFMVQGGDGYVSLGTGEIVSTARETIGVQAAEWLRERGPVAPITDARTLPVSR